jgi:tRNA U55 pseudouridine synthase TruB
MDAAGLDRLEDMSAEERRAQLMSMRRAMRDFPAITVDGDDLRAVRHGQPIAGGPPPQRAGELSVLSRPRMRDVAPHEAGMTAGIPVGVLDPAGHLIAVYRRSRAGLRPAAVFP